MHDLTVMFEDINNIVEVLGEKSLIKLVRNKEDLSDQEWEFKNVTEIGIQNGGKIYNLNFDKISPTQTYFSGKWLSDEDFNEIFDMICQSRMGIDCYTTGINLNYLGSLPHVNIPNTRIRMWLGQFNRTATLTDGTIPMRILLKNISMLQSHTRAGSSAKTMLQKYFPENG